VESFALADGTGGGSVLITWPDFPIDGTGAGALLKAAGLALRDAPKFGARSISEVRRLSQGAIAAIVSTDPFDASVFAACPTLRVIARVGVGVDSIDVTAASTAGVAVTTTPGANEGTTAEHAVTLMLATVRRVVEHDSAVRAGRWARTGRHIPGELAGRTVGLVGYGRIGKLVASRLSPFGVRIVVCDPNARVGEEAEQLDELEELLAAADIVSIHVPLQPDTRGLIGLRELQLMGPHSILINTARGGIVDEQALVSALEHRRIAAAALDVFESEPPTCQRLLALPNVVLTPHTGGISEQSVARMLGQATTSVLAALRGERPLGLVNEEVLAHPRWRETVGSDDEVEL
jgi:D-3-phosphoglycerate dehydrogenase